MCTQYNEASHTTRFAISFYTVVIRCWIFSLPKDLTLGLVLILVLILIFVLALVLVGIVVFIFVIFDGIVRLNQNTNLVNTQAIHQVSA